MRILHLLLLSCLVHLLHPAAETDAAGLIRKDGNKTDHLALLEFKAKITEDPFGLLESWNESTHFCQWHGVTCGHRHRRVTILDLSHSKLAGSISPHIGNLSFLRKVYLQNNSLSLQIPPEMGRLRRLQVLELTNNSIQGTMPPNISACNNLVLINFAGNRLMGQIPAELGFLSKLQFLYLSFNNLTGTIPSSLGNLSALELFAVPLNNLVGNIPDTFGQLKNLSILALGLNRLSGTVPLSISNLSSMTAFDVVGNKLHGSLPIDLGNTLPNLQYFGMGENHFTGSLPTSISNATRLTYFRVPGNQLTGQVPSLENLLLLQSVLLSGNNLGSGSGLDQDQDLSFVCSLRNASSLRVLTFSENNFFGSFPECIGNLSATLDTLYLQTNNIFGSIPPGIGNLFRLEDLQMENNQLSGELPEDIGKLQKMHELNIAHNNLSGKIPDSFGNLSVLAKLYLHVNNFQGNIPSSLGQCQNLVVLNLRANSLNGSIPPQVIGLSSLSIALELSNNQLSGVIPKEVANLKNLGFFAVSDNLLSGEIPVELGTCVQLLLINISGNFFHGGIPSSLASLRGIVVLDFSHNNLSGEIPAFLGDFVLLLILNLSHNNFRGMMPTRGVFKNASATTILGNSELCGGVPDFHLPKCNSKDPKKRRLTHTMKLVITSVSGLLGVAFVLYFLFFCYSRNKKKPSASTSSRSFLVKLSYQDLLKATDMFSSTNVIGIGGFGTVYKGVLDDEGETVVAVKVFNLLRPGASKSFTAECEALRNIRHRNLVKVLTTCSGIDYSGNDFKALVYEFMVNGSLEDWLHPSNNNDTDEGPRTLDLLQRLNVMIDVASALCYLHHHHQRSPIVHCDLKPSNVLLDGELMAHVGDFGLARFLQDVTNSHTSSIGIKGSTGYAAPEYGMGSELSTYGDAYSYGILLLEVFTGRRPTDDMFGDDFSLRSYVEMALPERVMEISDSVLVQHAQAQEEEDAILIQNCLTSVFGIGVACSAQMPTDRLSFQDVQIQLCTVRSKLLEN